MAQPDAPVALVVSQFPRFVDAYFLREITALHRRGIRFRIYSLRRFGGAVIHNAAKPFLPDTVYVPFLFSWPLLRENLGTLVRRPGAYLGALAAVVRGSFRRPRSLLRALAVFPKTVYFARLAREDGVRHIHANWASHPATAALVMARLTGLPWSFGAHASDVYVDGAMLPEKIRAARFVVTCTRHNRDYLATLVGPDAAQKVVVSYHGVDLERFTPARTRKDGPLSILTVGSLRECKGLPDLIEACKTLEARGVPFSCTIVGDGEERRAIERQIERAGLRDRIRITGYLAQEALIPLYQQASVVVLPALSESHFGIPNVLLEALAVETPVICTALPSLSEVIADGVHGRYVPEQSPAALAAALEALAKSPEAGRAMGRAGRQVIEALFDAAKNADVLDGLFSSKGASTVPSEPRPGG